jgi:hypothetical protein
MRAAILAACLMTTGSMPVAYARWSDPATWGGVVPTSGPVVVPPGQTVYLDVSTASLGALTINGTLLADPSVDVGITAANIVIGATGALQVGSESQRYTRNCVITLTGAENGRAARFVPVHDNPVDGKGRPSRLAVGTGLVSGETITLTFTSATAFTASSSTAGAMPSGTVGTYYSSRVQFMPTSGSTAWVAGDTVIISAGTQLGFTNDGVGRSLVVQPGGKLKLFGALKTAAVAINASAASGATALTLDSAPIGWAAGDAVVVGPSDFYGTGSGTPHAATLASTPSGAACALSSGLNASRWGVLQYPTDTGISTTQGAFTLGGMRASADVPTVIDQRARVINKTRNIVIQGADDAAWSTSKFGAHCMVMGLASVVQLDGVEFRRVGQAGAIGRYPIHWHMLSYGGQQGGDVGRLPSDGTFLGQIPNGNAYLRNSSIHTSGQRGTVIHGTWGVEVSGNVYHDITAHCVFMEDSAEQNNTISGNYVIGVSEPAAANRLLKHEQVSSLDTPQNAELQGSSGFWFSNPSNTFENNYAASCAGVGIWNAFQEKPYGLCIEVDLRPRYTRIKTHGGNYAIGNGLYGMMTRFGAGDSRGTTAGTGLASTDNDRPTGTFVRQHLTDQRMFKNRRGGYFNEVIMVQYSRWVTADNGGMDFSGVSNRMSFMTDNLGAGVTLNNSNPPNETMAVLGARAFMASYHGFLLPTNCSIYNFPATPTTHPTRGDDQPYSGGGMVRTDDFYINPVEPLPTLLTNVKFHNASFGYHSRPSFLDGRPMSQPLSLAIYDKFGLMGGGNETYVVYDYPFLTHGAAGLTALPGNPTSKATTTKMFGWRYGSANDQSVLHPHFSGAAGRADAINYAMNWVRQDPVTGADIATWASPSLMAYSFPWTQSAAMPIGGRYKIVFPDGWIPSQWATFNLTNAWQATDTAIIGHPWAGATVSGWCGYYGDGRTDTPTTLASRISQGANRILEPVGSMAALTAATTNSIYLDTSAQIAWIKHVGGFSGAPNGVWDPITNNSADDLMRDIKYRITT